MPRVYVHTEVRHNPAEVVDKAELTRELAKHSLALQASLTEGQNE